MPLSSYDVTLEGIPDKQSKERAARPVRKDLNLKILPRACTVDVLLT